MKTKHLNFRDTWGCDFTKELGLAVSGEMRQLGTFDNKGLKMRLVTCGKAVIILPETDTTKDCTVDELLKAMHCQDRKSELTKENYKTIMVNNRHKDELYTLNISPAVDKFIDWCSENGFFDEGYVEFDPQTEETFTF